MMLLGVAEASEITGTPPLHTETPPDDILHYRGENVHIYSQILSSLYFLYFFTSSYGHYFWTKSFLVICLK